MASAFRESGGTVETVKTGSTSPGGEPKPVSAVGAAGPCQLQRLPDATLPLQPDELAVRSLGRGARKVRDLVSRVRADPSLLWRKAVSALRGGRRQTPGTETAQATPAPATTAPLRPGDRVRVRSFEEIQATLDATSSYRGLGYEPVVMNRYCGGTFVVRKRIDRFFDERRWKMLKVREVVILEGVFCEPPPKSLPVWAGCDRSCFLFWKEAWLERVDDAATAPPHS